jgi:salicylate hydroxylase
MNAPLRRDQDAHAHPVETRLPSPSGLHVVVIGGGVGGLALAQGLKKAGVSVAVYERDRTPTDRVQGYRVHINPAGSRALHACLPAPLFEAFARTCGRPSRAFRFLTERFDVLLTVRTDIAARDPIAQHRPVSRITLRQVLLSGLDGIVHFGKTFSRYETRPNGRIAAFFEDGTSAEGDILVAADGGGSRVRRQLLPHAERIDTGVAAIAGKVFLDEETRRAIAPVLLDGMALVSAKGGVSLFVALQDLQEGSDGEIGGNDDRAGSDRHFENTQSYLMWALSARRERFGVDLDTQSRAGLRATAMRIMSDWDPRLRDLVARADEDTISALMIRTSVPVSPWASGCITLLGDAIHSMTPYRGIGANVALKDAARLCDALISAHNGERDVIAAISAYESEMRRYGFAAVAVSRQSMEQALTTDEFKRSMSRLAFRAIDRVPALKQWMFRRMGEE